VFLDTTGCPGTSELLMADGVCNPGEADMVGRLIRGLLRAGARAADIGLVSPYRAQVGEGWRGASEGALRGLLRGPLPAVRGLEVRFET